MADINDLLVVIKQAALDAVENVKPTAFMFGTVESDKPLRIKIDSKLVLDEAFLTLTRNVTKYSIDIEIEEETEVEQEHKHKIKGKKKVIVDNSLKVGDIVLIAREQGGQRFIIIDKAVGL